jgi:alanyl-tRNA synthetase
MKEFNKAIKWAQNGVLGGQEAFKLHDTYGFPIELTKELAEKQGIKVDVDGYKAEKEKHQQVSRANLNQVFKGGLASSGEMETKYHTCTHLVLGTLRRMFGDQVEQRGSNITAERMRFDFNLDRKMTDEEKQQLEDIVNQKIAEDLVVTCAEMTPDEAHKSGAIGIFNDKYGEKITVYSIGDYDVEICGGPHVKHTGELGHFKLLKEESCGAGVRRIKGILE